MSEIRERGFFSLADFAKEVKTECLPSIVVILYPEPLWWV